MSENHIEKILDNVLFGGVFENEGHIVQFTLLDDNSVEIYEQLQAAFKTHESRRRCSAQEALKKQQVLLNFKYEHYGYGVAEIEG